MSPSGSCAGSDRRAAAGAGRERLVVGEDDPCVSWGSAEFVAAEEMGRARGFWWSPDGRCLAVARVDTSPVPTWWVADAANPGTQPVALRYPAAGTANADVTLHVVDPSGRSPHREVLWDRAALPYLAAVDWPERGPLTLTVQSRDQRRLVVLVADPASGETTRALVPRGPPLGGADARRAPLVGRPPRRARRP